MLPAIISAAARFIGSRAAGSVATARGAYAGMSDSALIKAQSAARSNTIGESIRGGMTPKQAMKSGRMAENRIAQQEADRAQAHQKQTLHEQKRAYDAVVWAGNKFNVVLQKTIHPLDTIIQYGQKMAGFVQFSNPAIAHQFNIAVENAYAAIGHHLEPALRGVTVVIRAMGKVMSGIAPIVEPAAKAVEQFLNEWAKVMVDAKTYPMVADLFATALKGVVDAMRLALPVMKGLMNFAAKAVQFHPLAIAHRIATGHKLGEGFDKSLDFKAVRQPQFAQSRESVYNPVALAAIQTSYAAGGQKKETDAEKAQRTLDESRDYLAQIARLMEKNGLGSSGNGPLVLDTNNARPQNSDYFIAITR